MATENQYRPWEESGETELRYYHRRFLEESGRAEAGERLLETIRDHLATDGGTLAAIDAFLAAAPVAPPERDDEDDAYERNATPTPEEIAAGHPAAEAEHDGYRYRDDKGRLRFRGDACEADCDEPGTETDGVSWWCPEHSPSPAAPPEAPDALPVEVRRVVEAAGRWADSWARCAKWSTEKDLAEAVAALRASRAEAPTGESGDG